VRQLLGIFGVVLVATLGLTAGWERAAAQTKTLDNLGSLEVGGAAPDFSALAFDDRLFHLKGLLKRRKPAQFVVVSFWSTTCKHCRQGLQVLDGLAAELGSDRVHFVLVSCDPEPDQEEGRSVSLSTHARNLRKWLTEAGLKLHDGKGKMWLLWDPDLAIARRYQVYAEGLLTLPCTFVITREGQLSRIISSEGDDFKEIIRKAVGGDDPAGGRKHDGR
jgi:peroxiredoxin